MAAMTCHLLLCAVAVFATVAGVPDSCAWTLHEPHKKSLALSCDLRTIGSDFDNGNVSVSQSERTVQLNILCSDVLFFQSNLTPRIFQRFYNLEAINIEYCKLTNLPGGSFLGLDAMRHLSVKTHNSDWSAVALQLVPESLVGMPHLERLDLGQNNIWNLPERVFCPLPALRHLNLTWNRLQDVSEVGVTGSCGAHLVTLDLSGNDLVMLPDSGLAGLESLQTLFLQHNEIFVLADGSFVGLSTLQILNISCNKITTLPPDIFNETIALTELYLQNNSLSVLAPGLFASLSQLTILDMSFNVLTSEWVTVDTFRGLKRVVVLNLSHNRLSQINSDMFRDLSTLQVLDLSQNDLQALNDKTFIALVNLHRLDLSWNRLSTIDDTTLSGLHVVSLISLSHNNISKISPGAFKNCSSLRDLRLEYNLIDKFPAAISQATPLRTLKLSHNLISGIASTDLSSLSSLRHLDLSSNQLRGLCKMCLATLTELEVLDVSRNELASIPHGVFDANSALQLLRLDGNKISDINGLFASLPNLMWLNVSDNRITWFDYALVPVQLLYLDLHSNKIRDLGNYFMIENKLRLRTLDVSHNELESLHENSVPDSVELLFANSNKITRMAPGTFSEKHNLSMVDLYDNLLSKIDLNAIRLPPVAADRNLPEFYIGGNPIFCDCHMEWMHRVNQISNLRQHPRVMDLDKVVCTLPYPRSGDNRVAFLETHPAQFLCPYTSHCFALCQCCDFIACDCQMTCPLGCSCYHDDTWATNTVDCSARSHSQLPDDIPMDATIVYMDGNDINTLDAHHFIGRKNLRTLYLNGSHVEKIQNRTFHGLSSLKELHLHDNYLVELDGFEFELLDLLKELYLQNNRLKFINNITFSILRSLEVLRLDGNLLLDFPVWNFKLNKGLTDLRLTGNHWSCDCQYMVDFKNWLIREKDIVRDAQTIYCVSNSSGDPGPYIFENSYSCENFIATSIVQEKLQNDFLQPVLITVGIFFFVLVMGVAFAIFRVRLHERVAKKCSLKWFPPHTFTAKGDKAMLYDAFVSYSEMDAPFITEVFAPKLENGDSAYKLCLSSRDYESAGTYAGDFMARSVETSRLIILVLTKNFIDNDWCKFSFKAAHVEALKNAQNRVIVIICNDVNENEMDSDLSSIVKHSTRIKYDDKCFWNKLHTSLLHGATKMSQSCYITEANYVIRTPNHGGKLASNMMLSNTLKTPSSMHQIPPESSLLRYSHHPQASLNSDTDMDRTFVSVETAQSSLSPSLNHSYMSIDYGVSAARNSHIYASIDESCVTTPMVPTSSSIFHPSLPSVHSLHRHARLQHLQPNDLRQLLPQEFYYPQQRRPLPGLSYHVLDQPVVSAPYFI